MYCLFNRVKRNSYIFLKYLVVAVCSFSLAICFFVLNSNNAMAKSVYDNQPPLTDEELVSFMEILPSFRAWALPQDIKAQPIVNKMGKADFIYSDEVAKWVISKNWEPDRFFSVMGRAAAALAIIEEGNDFANNRPTDMPTVSESELSVVRKHLGSLLKAGNLAPPIK